MKFLLSIYDYLTKKRTVMWSVLGVILVLLIYLSVTLSYKEDITDFLPVDEEYRQSMEVYEQLSQASRIVLIFRGASADSLCEAVDLLADEVYNQPDLADENLVTEVDFEQYLNRLNYVHTHLPYFLTEEDYSRLDTLLTEESIRAALQKDKQLLSLPGSGVFVSSICEDPLSIFPLSAGASGQYGAASSSFTSYGGYMMSADETMAFAFYDSPYGGMESGKNAALVRQLYSLAQKVSQYSGVKVDLLGAPVIAVENAQRIKKDSLLAIGLSLIFITAILLYSFPRKRDILLIGATVAFGWLFGMAMLKLFVGQVSVIVLGIGSIIIGIVVNYPLHLLVHQRYTTSVRQTLEEVLSPLIIGNITTIGAFVALIPLRATALRDLGIFASSMLLGTILFCVLILPHLIKATPTPVREFKINFIRTRLNEKKRFWLVSSFLAIITIGLALVAIFSKEQLFDSNISHINYMTEQQRADFAYFEQFATTSTDEAYLATFAKAELTKRVERWNEFVKDKELDSIYLTLNRIGIEEGFRDGAFEPFNDILQAQYDTQIIENELAKLWPGKFDTASLNSRMAESLSENFNYIGLVCSLIVFLFLWASFKSIKLAIIAFLPMAISWVWIFGLMHLFGLHFNLVNIILATFIFGQGDDYTIFVVEGLEVEHKTGVPLLPQFKQSIFLSALIMLVGIGVLVLAKHPAMYGLGVVTLVGMGSVVILACTLPPLLFKLIKNKG